MSSLDRMMSEPEASRLVACAPGIQQEVSGDNLGYGNIYYAVARWLRPRRVLVVGSGNGFTPFVIAKALEHNDFGELVFVDPSMDALRNGPNAAHGGSGHWDTPEQVATRLACAGIERVTHYKLTNRQFFARSDIGEFELVVIDGAHDYENVLFDFNESMKHLRLDGYVFLHDSTHFLNRTGHMGVAALVRQLRGAPVELMTFPGTAGLTLVRVAGRFGLLPVKTLPPTPVWVWGGLAIGLGFLLGRWFGR